ncbi:MAG: hypothetical protein ACRDU5_09880 [Mycobacterium sp.]
MKSNQVKRLLAAIGASAVVAMGAFAVALSGDNGTRTVVSDPEATLGETSTSSTAPEELEISVASPTVTAEPPDGFGITPPG